MWRTSLKGSRTSRTLARLEGRLVTAQHLIEAIGATPDLIAALEGVERSHKCVCGVVHSHAERPRQSERGISMTERTRYAVMRLCAWTNIGEGTGISITPNKGSVGYIDVFRTRADAEDMAKFYEPTGGATIIKLTLTGKEQE